MKVGINKLKSGRNNQLRWVIILCAILFAPTFLFSQKDTTTLDEVTIKGRHLQIEEHTTLSSSEIEQLAPQDLGDLLQYITGITIKNYGGIGGMKTLSNRGLGGEHTQLIIDGLPVNNTQTGQVNLANIQPNHLQEVKVSYFYDEQLIPVSGLIKGSTVQLKSFNQQFSPHLFSARSSVTIGSFGQKEANILLKKGGKKNFISLAGGTRTYKGNYPYQLDFGDPSKRYSRRNNALDDYHISVGTGFKWGKNNFHHHLRVSAHTYSIQQELPGAVILYNELTKTTMQTRNSNGGLNYHLFYKNIALYVFVQYSNQFLHYHDPDYLNLEGFLDNQYNTNSILGGFHLRVSWKDFSFHAANDFSDDELESNRELGHPIRYSNTSMFKVKYNSKYFIAEASLFSQVFIDKNSQDNHQKDYYKIHPHVSISTSDQLFKDWQLFAWYKPSSRAPSFNELYFSQVGNKELIPEESSQIDLGFRYIKSVKAFKLQIQGNVFKNRVKNKILALPTKNLFIWSIQNVGEVDIFGGDLHFISSYQLRKYWKLSFQAGASYQKAIDISDSESPTYKNQIAYTPSLTGNATISAFYKTIGVHITGLYIGERYSLNENIPSNRLDPYFTLDCSASYALRIKTKHTFKIHLGVKNLGDMSYSFIRYYVMPGRNYYLKLAYEFN